MPSCGSTPVSLRRSGPAGAALLLGLAVLASLPAHARRPSRRAAEGPDYFAARTRWYVDTFGEDGTLDPEKRLVRVREAYAAFRRFEAARRARPAPAALDAVAFRFLGPANGAGRTPAVELHPTDPAVVYAGAAGGGCWNSTDGGDTWRTLTDGLADLSVGAVALAPSNPSIVYLGTGEGGYAGDFIPGIGILRSTDGGETWRLPDFVVAPMVYKLSVDPRAPDTVVAFTSNGAQRSTDGGVTWRRTSDPSWGDAADAARDAANPNVLHATFWGFAGGEKGKYARSTDAGQTWTEVRTGLPPDPKGRMSIAVSADGRVLYSLISASSALRTQLGLYASTDGGGSWAKASLVDLATNVVPDILSGQGSYDNCVAVDPDDPRTLLIGGGAAGQYRSTDGGGTVTPVGRTDGVHVDIHQLVVKRYGNQKLAWSANDGGLWSSTDGGVRWRSRNEGLSTRQYYAVAVDAARPDVAYAGSQDNGTDRAGGTPAFAKATGGDGFETAVDPASPATVYTTGQFATVFRSTRDGTATSFAHVSQAVGGMAFSRDGGDGVKPFFTRLVLDPSSPKTLYTGTYRVWRSEDGGESWAPLDSTGFSDQAEIRALAVSASRPERILAAQRAQLFLSDDRGAHFRALPAFSTTAAVNNVEIDPNDADTLYVMTSFVAPSRPGSISKSADAGLTWRRVGNGLPDFATAVVRVQPGDSRTVYAGTLVGLYRSTDAGETWARWGEGLPAAAVLDIRLAPDGSRITVATHGRGLWAADVPGANRPPSVTITAPEPDLRVAPGQSVAFTGLAADPDGDAVTSLRWDFGDGSTGSGAAPAPVVYRTPGVYAVSLVAEDAKGARGAALVTVTVVAPNDSCADALPVALVNDTTVVLRTGNGGAASRDDRDPRTCSDPDISNSVWFTVTPPADGTLSLDTFGSLGDTVMALYAGSCASTGPALDCNDDAANVSGGPSQLSPQRVVGGQTYRVIVGSWSDRSRGYDGPVDSVHVHAQFQPDDSPANLSPGTTALLPVVLDAFGKNGARFASDLTLLNRGAAPVTVALTYGGPLPSGADTTASLTLAAGAQMRVPDALDELRREGIAVPKATSSASQVGSLTALVTGGDPSSLVLTSRTASPNPNAAVGGTFGLFEAATPFLDAADAEPVYVYGLRQTERDRANLALVHLRTPHARGGAEPSITLSVEAFDANGAPAPRNPIVVQLRPGEWTQLGEVLSQAGLAEGGGDGGYARIRRTAGNGRFLAYGVVNDQRTADGSFIPMVKSGELTAREPLLVPIVLQAGGLGGSFFTSELVLANRSAKAGTVTLRYAASPQLGGTGSGEVSLPLGAGAQRVVPDVIAFLRESGLAIPASGAQGGALFVSFTGFDATDDVYAGVRTSTPNPDHGQGGSFGVFSAGVAASGMASAGATVPALRQDASARSNVAAVNGGASPITLSLSLRSSANGAERGTTLTKTLAPGEWYQWSNVFALAGAGEGEGYALITRTSGDGAWLAYGVLNDAKTSDGSVVTMVR